MTEQNATNIEKETELKVQLSDHLVSGLGLEPIFWSRIVGLVKSSSVKKLVLDMEGANFISSAALGQIVALHKATGCEIVFCNVQEAVRNVIRIVGFDRVFKVAN